MSLTNQTSGIAGASQAGASNESRIHQPIPAASTQPGTCSAVYRQNGERRRDTTPI